MAFRYTDLLVKEESIRLLHIAPSSYLTSTQPLQCSLLTTKLDNAPVYTALSYTWGDDTATAEIFIDGRTFLVRPNLHSALLSLRNVSLRRILWVDAICINQENAVEKEYQVGIMRDVYRRASEVAIWLNNANDEIAEAFTFIRELDGSGGVADVSGDAFENKLAQRPWEVSGESALHCSGSRDIHVRHAFSTILTKVFTQDWWSRIWVIQEVAVSRLAVIRCGNASLRWLNLVQFLSKFSAQEMPHDVLKLRYLRESFQGIDAARRLVSNGNPIPLLNLLIAFRSFDSHDPRDKVYAILGLAKRDPMGIIDHVLRTNYLASVESTYKATLQYLVSTDRSLDVLSTAGRRTDLPAWPSWLPSWDLTHPPWHAKSSWQVKHAIPYFFLLGTGQKLLDKSPYKASGNSSLRAHLSDLRYTIPRLCAESLKVGTVLHVGITNGSKSMVSKLASWFQMLNTVFLDENAELERAASFWEILEDHRRFHSENDVVPNKESTEGHRKLKMHNTGHTMQISSNSTRLTAGTITETCYRTLTANRDAQGLHSIPDSYLNSVLDTQQFVLAQESARQANSSSDSEKLKTAAGAKTYQHASPSSFSVFQDFMIAVEQATSCRTLFITEQGHIGLGPSSIEVNSDVHVVLGCSVPLIIRSSDAWNPLSRQAVSSGKKGKGDYVLIGECYLHGFMDGEAVAGERWQERVETLSLI